MKTDHEFIAQNPEPGPDPVERLLHVAELFKDVADDEWAILATSNVYGPGIRTGLTWGDIAALAHRFEAIADRMAIDASARVEIKAEQDRILAGAGRPSHPFNGLTLGQVADLLAARPESTQEDERTEEEAVDVKGRRDG